MQPALSITHTHVQTHIRRQNTRHRRILNCPPKGKTNQVRPHGIILSQRKPQLHTPRNKGDSHTEKTLTHRLLPWVSLPCAQLAFCPQSSSPWETDLIGVPCPPHPLSQVLGLPRNRHPRTHPLPGAADSRCSAARLPLPLAWGSHLSSSPPWSWRLFSFSSECVKTQIRAIRDKSLQGKAEATTAPDCQLQQGVVKHRLTHSDYKLEQIPKQEGAERRGSKFHFRFSCFSSNLLFAVCSSFHSHAPKRGR